MLHGPASGAFNIASQELLPLSALVRLVGGRSLPVPGTVLGAALELLSRLGLPTAQPSLLEYLRFNWVADCARAREVLGFVPSYTAADAMRSARGT